MRRLLTLTILFLFFLQSFGQTDTSRTEIIIIGTIHSGNKYLNDKTLYKLLKSLNPDIILDEYSETYKPVFGLQTATFLKIAKPGIEQSALQRIARRHKKIVILPYDTAFARKQYIKEFIKFESLLYDSLSTIKKEHLDSMKYGAYTAKRDNYYELFLTQDLQKINEVKVYTLGGELYKADKELILPLIKKYVKDSSIARKFEANLKFWNDRNNFMVRQIEKISTLNPGKRIVVLTGLNHKYFLTEKLTSNYGNNIKLTEISDM